MLSLEELYKIAKKHKDEHRGCGAEPYLDHQKLFEILNFEKNKKSNDKNSQNFKILELGMGIGFTALVMNAVNSNIEIDTIETHGQHLIIARNWFREFKNNINIIQADVHKVLPYLESDNYDFIFFDVYGPKEKFLIDFERILKTNGILYSVNSHLESAENAYFEKLENSENWVKLDEFNDTKIYRKLC